MLTDIGLVHLLVIKEQYGKPAFLQMRPWQLQHLEIIQRTCRVVRGASWDG